MIKTVIVSYGNIGKAVFEAVKKEKDFSLEGILIRNYKNKTIPEELRGIKISDNIDDFGQVDVAIIGASSRSVMEVAKTCLEKSINTVDSFDMHDKIYDLREELKKSAEKGGSVAITAAGWDPGADSVIRVLFEAMAPKGITNTNFGPGMSMGHTVAVKNINGVKNALSVTVPAGMGIHKRMVYVEIEDGADFKTIEAAIKSDPYFVNDETNAKLVSDVDSLIDTGHGVNLVRRGVSGETSNQFFEYNMRADNPALTAQILVSAARASMRQKCGCYTLPEIPPIDLLYGDREDIIKNKHGLI